MKIRLLCVRDFTIRENEWNNEATITFLEGNEYNAEIDDIECGIRLELPTKKNCYSLSYYISDIEKHFISASDKERYDEIYVAAKNCKMYVDSTCVELGNVTIKRENI